MEIEKITSGKEKADEIKLDGSSIPVAALKDLMNEGYVHIKAYQEEGTFSLWGKSCTGCFSCEELREKSKAEKTVS